VCFTNPSSKTYKPPKPANAATIPPEASATQLPPGLDASAVLASLCAGASSSSGPALANAAPSIAPSSASALLGSQVEEFQRYLAAQALIKKAYGMRAAAHGGDQHDSSMILLDSGSTFHFTGVKGKSGITPAPPIAVTTASGDGCFDNGVTDIENSQVGSLQAQYAPGALPAAGLGKLIRELKLDFHWSWRDFDNPLLVDVDGEPLNIRVDADCPFLAASAALSSSEPGASATDQELNVNKCALSSHNYVTDSSHEDDNFALNSEMFVPPRDSGQITEAQVVACLAASKAKSNESEISLDGVSVEDDESPTLIMDEPCEAHHFLGIDISLHASVGTKRKCVLSQHKYALHILKYFASISPGLVLRKVQTPANDNICVLGLGEDDIPGKGFYAMKAARLIGMLLYLMRGTRSEIAVCLSLLGSFVTKWDKGCDEAVIRTMAYLQTYSNIVLELVGDSRDIDALASETFCDSDHGGDKGTSRSISGAYSFVTGSFGTRALIAWFAVKMKGSGISTGEVETAAASVSLRRLALPLASLLEFVFTTSKIITKLRGDATVAEHVFASGRSKAMRYLRKVHRISIHFVYDVLHQPGVEYEHVDSEINCSDLLTKPLVKDVHFRHCTFVGLVVLSETGEILAMSAASKGNKGLKAGSRRVWIGPNCPHSLEHMLLHLPMSADCETCQLAKISITPARRLTTSTDRATNFGERFYVDLIGPVLPDFQGNKYLLVARDEGTDLALVHPLPEKSGTTVTKAYKSVTSDAKILKVRPDWGKEFVGPFESHCNRVDTQIEKGLPRRSTTFARAERWHRTLEEGVRADLVQSGLGHQWWSLSAVMWCEHWNRLSREGRVAPYVKRYNRESGLELRPFGSLIIYLKDKPSAVSNLPKFEPRGEFGIVVGYGAYSSYVILQLAPFIQLGKRLFKRTRDVKFPVDGPKFPIRLLLQSKVPEVPWHFLCPCEDPESKEDPSVFDDGLRCNVCLGYISQEPVTCVACLHGGSKRLKSKTAHADIHVNGAECRLRRCACTTNPVNFAAIESAFDPLPPIEYEDNSLADICFGELLIPPDIQSVDADTVEEGFVEPETAHASSGVATLSTVHSCAGEAIRGFCMVYKSVSLKSESAHSVEAQAAIAKEVRTMLDLRVWDDYSTAIELWELHALHPDALVVYAHLLLGCKNVEGSDAVEGDPLQSFLLKWKARLVAGGNRLLDAHGVHYKERGLYGAPTSLEAIRLVCWWATMNPDHILLQADVSGAYLQSKLGGRPVWVVLPPTLWPEAWRDKGFRQPVLRLRKALYGLQRSGFDWAKKAHSVLSNLGWAIIPDVVDAVYILRRDGQICILALYVDDILAAGPSTMLVNALNAIRGV